MKKLFLTACSVFVLSNTLPAENSIGLNFNSDDVEFLFSTDLTSFSDYSSGTLYMLDTNYFHKKEEDGLIGIGISGQNELQGLDGMTLALGIKGVFTDHFNALPLTVKATFELPFEGPTTSLVTSIAYAPSVLSFVDAESYTEFRIEADMEVISNIHLFTGYRNINTEYVDNDKTFDDKFYVGMRLRF